MDRTLCELRDEIENRAEWMRIPLQTITELTESVLG
jgi:predicted trehalose synthase